MIDQRPERLAVLDIALCTAVGLDTAATQAAVGARIIRRQEARGLEQAGEPLAPSMLTMDTADKTRTERMLWLARNALTALRERWPVLRQRPTALCLALPEPDLGSAIYPPALADALCGADPALRLELVRDGSVAHGRAGFFSSLCQARAYLQTQSRQVVLIGGVDSLCDAGSLTLLARSNRLLSAINPDGLIASEGAGFVLLATEEGAAALNAQPMGWVLDCVTGKEPNHFRQQNPTLGQGLTEVFRALRQGSTVGSRADWLLSCQPCESYWTKEFMMAYLRNAQIMPEPMRMEVLGQVLGDCGAAAGAIQLGMGLHHLTELRRPGRAILFGSADHGQSGACFIESEAPSHATQHRSTEPSAVLWDVLEEHLDEAAFLWARRLRCSRAADHSLHEVERGPERRLLAHIHGLAVAGETAARRLLLPMLREGDAASAGAAALALLQRRDDYSLDAVLAALADAPAAPYRGILQALQLTDRPNLTRQLPRLLGDRSPALYTAALQICVAQGKDPGEALLALLDDEDPQVRTVALRAARFAPRREIQGAVYRALAAEEVAVQAAAVETGLILGQQAAWTACCDLVQRPGATGRLALSWMALLGDGLGMRRTSALLADGGRHRDLLWALGFDGTVGAAAQCVAAMDDPAQARLAAESFCLITGFALCRARGTARTPEEDDDEPRPWDPEQDLPHPDVAAVRSLWEQHRGSFRQDERYLLGVPHGKESLLHALAAAPMWRRPILALDLAMRTGGACQLRIELLAREQHQDLARFSALPATVYSRQPDAVPRH